MNYETQRNNVIRRFVSGIYHLNWIKLDGNGSIEHDKTVCDICIELKRKGLDFLTRPVIEINGLGAGGNAPLRGAGSNPDSPTRPVIEVNSGKEKVNSKCNSPYMRIDSSSEKFTLIPDLLTFIPNPFKPVVIEVTNSESVEHAKGKSYPDCFKVVPFPVDSSVKELEGMI